MPELSEIKTLELPVLQSVMSEVNANPILNGVDPLAALTDNLNQHIVAEAFKPKAPAPWEVTSFATPSTIPEDESFGFANHETLPRQMSSRLHSQVIPGNKASIRCCTPQF